MNGETRRCTFDTNILFYAADTNAAEKHVQALQLTRLAIGWDCFLTTQVLGEFFHAVTRCHILSGLTAAEILTTYRESFPIVSSIESDLTEAISAHREHGLQFWEAMLWATARRAGCTLLLSEDCQDGRALGGVLIRNPFTMRSAELEDLLSFV